MNVSAVIQTSQIAKSNQVSQAARTGQISQTAKSSQTSQAAIVSLSSQSTSTPSTVVTTTDPTLLSVQANQDLSQITQLQRQHGSAQLIARYQQALQAVKSQMHRVQELADDKQASAKQASAQTKAFARGIDAKA
ncbi:hypothetical protein [Desulfosporosinus sp. FKB]|uniref:hypothetical protein n=1 Tax=Desulfosporosinus sp. FKB TaxID=1969835 RepID=UPI000B49B4E8|nr:hypothetical protein [Desulfosporosinus sp. FKB]